MKLYTYTLFFFAFILFTNYTQAQSDKATKIETYLQSAKGMGLFNGNILVTDQGKTIYKASFGYADALKQNPLTENNIFYIGSIAKEFNAVGIMLLKEQGKLTLDQKVSDFFPDLPSWAQKISIKNLLQYTSGLPDVKWYTAKNEADNWKNLYATTQLNFEPGKEYAYHNNNTFLQRKIIEKVTGMKFNDFVQQELLKPCDIKNGLIDPTGKEPFMTQSFNDDLKLDSMFAAVMGWTCLNINDFYKWANAITSFKIINPSSTQEIITPYGPRKQCGLGYGTMKDNAIQLHVHDGTSYSSQALLVDNVLKKRTIILMTNQKHNNLDEIASVVNAILDDKPYEQPRRIFLSDFKKQLDTMNGDGFISFYKNTKAKNDRDYGYNNPNTLNEIGYFYLSNKRQINDAIIIFEYNATLFPNRGFVIDSLAEGYLNQGDKKKALFYYKKSLELGSDNPDAAKIIEDLEKQIGKG